MGMSASQARFLTLTARKTNTEYEGQQINQQRTMLSNESSNYYSQLASMTVPTPPSPSDYTKLSYTFNNGNTTNTITSLVATPTTASTGIYKLNYTQQILTDTMKKVNSQSRVAQITIEASSMRYFINEAELVPPVTIDDNWNLSITEEEYMRNHLKFSIPEEVVDSMSYEQVKEKLTNEALTFKYYQAMYPDTEFIMYYQDTGNGNYNPVFYKRPTVSDDEMVNNYHFIGAAQLVYACRQDSRGNLNIADEESMRLHFGCSMPMDVVNSMSVEEMKKKLLLEVQYVKMLEEKYGIEPVVAPNYVDKSSFKVIYKKSPEGAYEPQFYSDADLENIDYHGKTGLSIGGLNKYVYGQDTETREIKNKDAKVEQDASGRYISIIIYDDENHNNGTKYNLTVTTISDENGYNDAMNQYYFNKAVYDQKVQEINAKIEIIQAQDKNLELKLKQLDTEENAIQTELDAVKKVISKNVESSFKTFNA